MGLFDNVVKPINDAVGVLVDNVTNATIDFRNSTNTIILVVMDSNRESHRIAAGGQATFGKANIGDKPTFYVKDESGDKVLFSRQVGVIGAKSSFGWNGTDF